MGGVKEEKPSHSPVLPPSPFSPALRQDLHKPDNKHLKTVDGSRPGPRLSDLAVPPQQDNKIKQEPKTPIAPKKTQVCPGPGTDDGNHSHVAATSLFYGSVSSSRT